MVYNTKNYSLCFILIKKKKIKQVTKFYNFYLQFHYFYY